MEQQYITIPASGLYELAEGYMHVMCGFDRGTRQAEKSRRIAMQVRAKLFDHAQAECLAIRLDRPCIRPGYFSIEGERLPCTALDRLDMDSVRGGYAFLLHAPMPDLSALPISEIYLADCWETCLVDAARDRLRQLLLEQELRTSAERLYISEALAPGMYGMKAKNVAAFFAVIEAERIGLRLLESGMMDPVKSFAGIFVLLAQDTVVAAMDCAHCLSGHRNCAYCKNYAVSVLEKQAEKGVGT